MTSSPPPADKHMLFVFGVARSGTSALAKLLNLSDDIMIGQERYYHLFKRERIGPEHFTRARFLDRREGDTHPRGGFGASSDDAAACYDRALHVGDKYPSLFRNLDHMFATFPEARSVYILRNPLSVLESYDKRFQNPDDRWSNSYAKGMESWNESIARVAALPEERLKQFHFVEYERIFSAHDEIGRLFAGLGAAPPPEEALAPILARHETLQKKPVPRRDDIRRHMARHADWAAYRRLCDVMERECA